MAWGVYVLLGVSMAVIELARIRKGYSFDSLTFFQIVYFLLFVFAPINMILLGGAAVRQANLYEQFGSGDINTAIALVICYTTFVLGYLAKD